MGRPLLAAAALGVTMQAHGAPPTFLSDADVEVVDVRGVYDEPSPLSRRRLGHGRRMSEQLQFSEDLAKRVAGPSRAIILSFTNRIRLDFVTTWVHHVRALGLSNFLIGATDDVALKALRASKTPCFSMKTNLPEGEWAWGSPSFKALGPHKIELIYKSLLWGLEVVITDIDALVLRDPFPYMARFPDAGFLTTSDHLSNTTSDGGLEDHRAIHSAYNIGYMFFRPSALPLVIEWRRYIGEDPRNRWDQGEFNRIARKGWLPNKREGLSDPRLFWAYESKVVGGVLPLSLFCGGHNYFVAQLPHRLGQPAYSVHTTFQYSAAAGKRHRLREAMVWIDEPAYYDPPGGLLTFSPSVPESLVHPEGGMNATGHIALINHQLRQIRSALAVATSIGRLLILPEVTCGYDKAWYALASGPSRGVFGGAPSFVVPIRKCPLDHFLEVGPLEPVQTIREFSLLSNPRTPASVTASMGTATIDTAGGASELARLASEYRSKRVLHVSNLAGIDGTQLLTTPQQLIFKKRFMRVTGSWCCASNDDLKHNLPKSARFSLLKA
jgi:hypothetical protein